MHYLKIKCSISRYFSYLLLYVHNEIAVFFQRLVYGIIPTRFAKITYLKYDEKYVYVLMYVITCYRRFKTQNNIVSKPNKTLLINVLYEHLCKVIKFHFYGTV